MFREEICSASKAYRFLWILFVISPNNSSKYLLTETDKDKHLDSAHVYPMGYNKGK